MNKILIGLLTLFVCLTMGIVQAASIWGSSITDTAHTRWLNLSEVPQAATIATTTNTVAASGSCTSGSAYKWYKVVTYPMYTPTRYFLATYNQTCS